MLQWGEREGVLYFVDDVENGDACKCVCCRCGRPLIAKNKGLIKTHHFAHWSDMACEGAVESAVHKLAKQVLANTRKLMLPPCEGNGPHGPKDYVLEALIEFERVETEVNIEVEGEIIRPDAIGYAGGKKIFIEFCFTHQVSDLKGELIRKSNTSCIEIFLDLTLQEPGKMEALLHDSLDSKQWIFHRALERMVLADWEQERERLKAREKKLAEQDRLRRIREEQRKKAELERQRREQDLRNWREAKRQAKLEEERRKKEHELTEAKKKGYLYKHCPIVGQFLEKFYHTSWARNEVINALRSGVWFQRKIFYNWPEGPIDIFVDNKQYILVPRKEEYDQLPEEQQRYHYYLMESVEKYDKLYHRSVNHCTYCNMFAGNVYDFIICKFNHSNNTESCFDYDKL